MLFTQLWVDKTMRIAFLCKRHYTGKDVMTDRFGRLYEIPHQLALLGHEVKAWCFDYHGDKDEQSQHKLEFGYLAWSSTALKGMRLLRLPAHLSKLKHKIETFKPDIVIGASDIPHVFLAAYVAKQLNTPCVIDLYDNFESFAQARIPLFKTLLKYAICQAHLVITVSQPLKEKVQHDFNPICSVYVMTNGINKNLFSTGSKDTARERLGLPLNVKLIGTAGSLSRMKGVDTIYAAWSELEQKYPDLHLILAGSVEATLPIPNSNRVHYLGVLSERDVITLFQALDVGIISLQDSSFGRYCFPQKMYEMLACGLAIVSTDVGVMSGLLHQFPQLLYKANHQAQLAKTIEYQVNHDILPSVPILSWQELVSSIEPLLKELIISHSH